MPLHVSNNSTHSVGPCLFSGTQDMPALPLKIHVMCSGNFTLGFIPSYVSRDCLCPACNAGLAEAARTLASSVTCTPALCMHGTRPTTTPSFRLSLAPRMPPQVYVLSVPADEGDGWVFPTATHPLILDLANHVAPGKVDSRHVTCAPRLFCEVLVRPLDKYMIPFGTLHGDKLPFPGQGCETYGYGPGLPRLPRQGGRPPCHALPRQAVAWGSSSTVARCNDMQGSH